MLWILAILCSMTIGGLAGLRIGIHLKDERREDYKDRWLKAVALLGEQGNLTDEQVKTITAPAVRTTKDEKPVRYASAAEPGQMSQEQLNRLGDPFRRDIEITRIKEGYPPRDTLEGMAAPFVRDVERARAKEGY
jgi:hypothetical protein